ncbi:MBL fold metallo-hydrolase [Flavitalea flava]
MAPVHILDLHFKAEESIAAFLIPTSEGPVLIETGPESTWDYLEAGIRQAGYQVSDIRHVLVTHIHLDHSGAAWRLAKNGATIYVHPNGLPHLANPEKLWNSASQIYGAEMGSLWGRMEPVPMEQLKPVGEGDTIGIGDLKIDVWYTPGHAIHHNVYQAGDSLFTGDVAGVKIGKGHVQPPCPPPDINIELWLQSIKKLKDLNPSSLYLTHFGKQDDPSGIFLELEDRLQDWANWIKPFFEKGKKPEEVIPAFKQYTMAQYAAAGLQEEELMRYEYANPAFMSVTGLFRYWKLKTHGRL